MTGERILVVEDNQLNLKLVSAVLEHAGYLVRPAGTAEDGVAWAVADPPDLVLMDLQLPGMDGFAGLRALRADPATCSVPVLAVTALAMPEDRERVRFEGFDGHIEKPISVRGLPEQVREVLNRRRESP